MTLLLIFILMPAQHADASPGGAEILIKDFTESAFLRNGLKYLGPGQEVESNISAIHKGFDKKIGAIMRVDVQRIATAGRKGFRA